MITALDTNIVSTLWSSQPYAVEVSRALRACSTQGQIVISPFVFAELLAHPTASESSIRAFTQQTGITIEFGLANALWLEAGLRYRHYADLRRTSASGLSRRILADFLIGAHAMLHADRLLTRDQAHFQQNFPELTLVDLPA